MQKNGSVKPTGIEKIEWSCDPQPTPETYVGDLDKLDLNHFGGVLRRLKSV